MIATLSELLSTTLFWKIKNLIVK